MWTVWHYHSWLNVILLENNKKVYFYIVDHKLRKNSTFEANLVKKKLKSFQILSKILTIKKKIYQKIFNLLQEKIDTN